MLLVAALPVAQGLVGAATETDQFSLTLSPTNQQIQPGGSTGYTVEGSWVDGFDGAVELSIDPDSALPEGLTATFSEPTITPDAPASILTINADQSFGSAATVAIVVRGTSGELTATSNAASVVQVELVPRCRVNVTVDLTDRVTGAPIADAVVRRRWCHRSSG